MNAPETGSQRNILLTGIPRSGTTLCCRLLNEFEDVVALVEPFSVQEIAAAKLAGPRIASLIRQARLKAESGIATSKLYAGQIAENIIAEKNQSGLPRKEQIDLGDVYLGKSLALSGTLIIKHNAMFTALSGSLQKEFPIYALVRNPLSVLASWNSVALPVGQGRVPAGELFCEKLREQLDAEPNVLGRQLIILDWFFQSYAALPPSHVLRYETIVAEQHSAFTRMLEGLSDFKLTRAANTGDLENQNSSYAKDSLGALARTLLKSDAACWNFYSPEDVEALLL